MLKRRCVLLAAVSLVATSCTTLTPQQIWMRTDGQKMTGNPALTHQYEIDRTICRGEVARAPASGGGESVFQGCMARQGYLLVPGSQIEERAATARAVSTAPQR